MTSDYKTTRLPSRVDSDAAVYLHGAWIIYKQGKRWTGSRLVRADQNGLWWQGLDGDHRTKAAACRAAEEVDNA